jgi:outer membrane protein
MKKFPVILLILVVCIGSLICYLYFAKEKTAYVDIKALYEGFDMKKELSDKLTRVQTARSKILDSLEMELKILSQRINLKKTDEDMAVFNVKRESFFSKKQQFEEDNQATVADYDAKILKQLNQYIEDYGKLNSYTYIYGSSGNGELLYGDKNKEITKDLIGFVNGKYKGM